MKRLPILHGLIARLGLLALAPLATQAAVLSVLQSSFTVKDLGSPDVFLLGFLKSLPNITGPVQVTTSVIGVFADGGRDGASIGLNFPTLLVGTLTDINNIDYPVTGAGGAASFTAAGGAAGVIHSSASAFNAAGGPAGFGSVATMGLIPSTGGASTSQTHFGGVIMDKSGDGATMTGPIADFKVNGLLHTQLGATTSAVGLTGSVLENGVAQIPPPSGNSEIAFGLTLTEDDTAAMIGRQEIGGELLMGTVMALYPLAMHSEVIDCGAAGCNATQMTLGFFGSGNGDTYAFIVRQEISSVPETTSTALLGLGLFGLLATWQRARRTR